MEDRDETKRETLSLPLSLPGKKTTINLSTGRRYGVLGIERIPGYLTSIVRIRVAVATATAIVNTILNSIENLSPRLKRRPASGGRRTAEEEGWAREWIKYVTSLKAISAFPEGRSV